MNCEDHSSWIRLERKVYEVKHIQLVNRTSATGKMMDTQKQLFYTIVGECENLTTPVLYIDHRYDNNEASICIGWEDFIARTIPSLSRLP